MKKYILAALAVSVLATPVLAQDRRSDNNSRYEQRHDNRAEARADRRDDRRDYRSDRRDDRRDYRNDRRNDRQDYRRWSKGQRFDSRYARNYRVVDYRSYHLRPAPRGYRWVQSGNDAVMVGITTGIIAAVIAGAIN